MQHQYHGYYLRLQLPQIPSKSSHAYEGYLLTSGHLYQGSDRHPSCSFPCTPSSTHKDMGSTVCNVLNTRCLPEEDVNW